MKTRLLVLVTVGLIAFLPACKKDKAGAKKVDSIISADLRTTLSDLNLQMHTGDNPPNIEGSVYLSPNYLVGSNIPGDPPSGTAFVNLNVRFFEQKPDGSIKFASVSSGGASVEREESETAVVAGSGNDFSVYGRSTIAIGSNSVVVAYVYSGTVDGNVIKNFRKGIIVVDDKKGGPGMLKKGQARVFMDGNSKSEITR